METFSLLVVGLGNPDSSYRNTRHNVGKEFIGHLASDVAHSSSTRRQADILRLPSRLPETKLTMTCVLGGQAFFGVDVESPVVLATLKCYMNQSGGPLKALLGKLGAAPQKCLVAVDDFMIPFGSLRLRSSGSSGGHNGLKSIIELLGTEDFPRLRFGVGPVPGGMDPADFVLEKFTRAEQEQLPALFSIAKEGIKIYLQEGLQKAMSFLNKQHA